MATSITQYSIYYTAQLLAFRFNLNIFFLRLPPPHTHARTQTPVLQSEGVRSSLQLFISAPDYINNQAALMSSVV